MWISEGGVGAPRLKGSLGRRAWNGLLSEIWEAAGGGGGGLGGWGWTGPPQVTLWLGPEGLESSGKPLQFL